jgi:hypothetical protein
MSNSKLFAVVSILLASASGAVASPMLRLGGADPNILQVQYGGNCANWQRQCARLWGGGKNVGTNVWANHRNGDYSENGSCQLWNANGDKIFSVYSRKGDPAKAEGTWHTVQATGKLEGMTAEGKWMPIGAFPPVPNVGSACNHEWGTYSAK